MVAGSLQRLGAALAFVGLAAATATAACGGRTACFPFTQGEYQADGNACPSPSSALQNFTTPTCPGPVVAVNGPGSYDGELCCYPVTQDDIVADCGLGGAGGSGNGGSSSGPPPCSESCFEALNTGTEICGNVTGASGQALIAVQACLAEMCPANCVMELAQGAVFTDQACAVCLSKMCSAATKVCEQN